MLADVNECGSNPCENGGTCTDVPNGYTCACSSGYTGDECQTGIILVYSSRLIHQKKMEIQRF